MKHALNTLLATSLAVLALAGCKDERVNATPSGAGNSEAGASGGSATGTPNGTPSGTPTATGGNPNANGQPATPPPDGNTNTKQ